MARFRRAYGAGPLHLVAVLAFLAFAGYAAAQWVKAGGSEVLRWFLIALIGHDLILLPLYTAVDWIAFGGNRGRALAARARVKPVPFIRIPAALGCLLAVVFSPEILSRESFYRSLTGLAEGRFYTVRWLAATGIMFGLSAIVYALAWWRRRESAPRKRREPPGVV